jgi:hypothetical protein
MMRALACGLGVEGGHRIANWLMEGSRPGPANCELRPFSRLGHSRQKKRAQWCLENQGRPKHKAIPLLALRRAAIAGKKNKIKSAGKIDQCGETPRPLWGGLPFRGWRVERKGMALLPLAGKKNQQNAKGSQPMRRDEAKPRSSPCSSVSPPPRMETCRRST